MREFFDALLARLREAFDPVLFAETAAGWAENVIFALLTLLTYYLLWRLLKLVLTPVLKRVDVDQTTQAFFETVTRLVVMTIGTVAALSEVGINTASLLASLGVAGLTVGFAARDTLSNLISGIFIFWDRPFVIGDLIETDGHYGRVSRITLRSTRVVTVDGRMLAIPNTQVVNSTVASYTNFPHLRIDVSVTVGVEEDLGRARRALLQIVADDPRYLADPAPVVVVTALNDYNVALELRAWLGEERGHIPARFELREKAFEALREAGVHMPYETFALEPMEIRQAS